MALLPAITRSHLGVINVKSLPIVLMKQGVSVVSKKVENHQL